MKSKKINLPKTNSKLFAPENKAFYPTRKNRLSLKDRLSFAIVFQGCTSYQGNFQVPPKMVPLSHKAPIGFP